MNFRWHMAVLVALGSATLLMSGCYRIAAPEAAGTTVRVDIVSTDTSLVRARLELERALGVALVHRLGWQVAPNGSARLSVSLGQESIAATAGDRSGITARWRITLNGAFVFENGEQRRTATYSGIGHSGGLQDEADAIRKAAEDAAAAIVTQLELGLATTP